MESTIPKVSIIVPVYNVEKYLRRCMDSIINQTLEEIEIIAVNDGSTDSSLSVLQEYENKDKRVKIINHMNLGVSYSRNIGIDVSTGKYILFVDSDDWISKDMCEEMYNKALENKSDIIMCSYVREFDSHSKEKNFGLDKEKVYEKEDIELLNRRLIGPIGDELTNGEGLDSLGTIWAKLYKSDLIKNDNHRFIDLKEIGSAEDTLFNIVIFKNARKITFLNKSYYHYWKGNSNSITGGYNPNLRNQWNNLFYYIREFIEDNDLGVDFYRALDNRIAMSVLGLGLNECNKKNQLSFIKKLRNFKEILNDKLIRSSYDKFEINKFPIHWKLFYIFNKNKMVFSSFCMINTIEFLRTRI